MVKKLITKAEFARTAGVSGAAVTKALKKELGAALQGKRIDITHPAAIAYLNRLNDDKPKKAPSPPVQKKEKSLTGFNAKKANTKKAPPPAPPDESMLLEIPEDIRVFADMTLRELVLKFGTDVRFVDWLRATKVIEDINEKRLKNAVSKGELVARQLVQVGVIEPINTAMEKLLSDGAKTIARRSVAMIGADRTVDDVESFIKEQISSFIRPMKSKIAKALKDG